MNRERAETHLRQLAEAELRGATTPGRRDSGHVGSLPLVAQALIAVGAVDVGTADGILAEFDLALAVREPGQGGAGGAGGAASRRLARLTRVWSRRDVTGAFAASRQTAWRVVPVGQAIRIRDGAVRGELGLVSYLQTAHGGRFTVVGWGISGHSITTPPAADLPERWLSLLTRYHRRDPRPTPAPGSWAATASELPELDGGRVAVLGLHQSERGTILHLHAGGVMIEDDWAYYRGVRPMPVLWIRDDVGRWHATRSWAPRPLGDNGEVTLELEIAPPLEAGTAWIDIVAAGQSIQVQARLPLHWTWHP